MLVKDIMTREATIVGPDFALATAARLMRGSSRTNFLPRIETFGYRGSSIGGPEAEAQRWMHMTNITDFSDPSTWDPELDAVKAAPKHHKILLENDRIRVLEVTLEPNDEEPVHHHRWPSVFVLDQIKPPVVDISPDGERLPPNRDVIKALEAWDGHGCLVVNMSPQPPGRVLNESDVSVHGIRIEMKNMG